MADLCEQNGQTAQPLVANQNDQNVESLAHEIKKRRNREAAKKRREDNKQKMEDNVRQLENERANHDKLKKRLNKLKKKHADSSGKLEQMQKYTELIIGAYKLLQQTIEQQKTTAKQQNTMINMLMQLLVPGTTGFYTGETGLPVVHHPTINQSGAAMEPPGPVIAESLPQLHQWNTVEQPPLNYDGLTPGGDLFGNHALNCTSSPIAAMASGSSLMELEGLLAPGGQLPLQVTEFGTGGTGLPVYHPSISQSGTTMGSGGLANENSPGLPQSHVSQGLTHNHNQGSTLNTQLPLQVTGFGTGGTGLPVHHPSISQSGTTMGSGGLANENSPGLPQSHVSQGLTHNHNQGSTLNTQLPLQVTGFGTGGTGLPIHHPSISQSGTTMGSGGLANENSPGLPQSHVSQGLTHVCLPSLYQTKFT